MNRSGPSAKGWVWGAAGTCTLSISLAGLVLACHPAGLQARRTVEVQAQAPLAGAAVAAAQPAAQSTFEVPPAVLAQDDPAQSAPAAPADPVPAHGRELFSKQCAICHGEQGDGLGQFAYLMNPRPRNFQKGNFKLASTVNQIPSADDLFSTISRGMPGSAMPPWGHLPKSDIEALVTYVRFIHTETVRAELAQRAAPGGIEPEALSKELAERTMPGAPLYVPPEPPFDDVRWFRGRRIYLEACAACHGASGEPVPEAVKFDDEGYPVPPRSFVNGIFKGGSAGHQLYARIVKGLRGTPMPAYEGTYNDDETWDLIHYVQSLARAGAQDRAQLRQETIVAPRTAGPLPAHPLAPEWDKARPVFVGLTPLWWTEERIEGLVVQALHDDQELVIRLSWLDATADERAVRHDEFRDAVAIQFALTPDPPFYMGDRSGRGGVNIWLWKADRQKDLATGYQDVDDAFPLRAVDTYPEQRCGAEQRAGLTQPPRSRITEHDALFVSAWGAGNLVANPALGTSVESLVAHGPGTLAGRPANMQFVQGQAVYQRGVWTVQMQRSLQAVQSAPADERVFSAGDYLALSIAIWNGSSGDRDGKKNISIWQKLVIE